jgi:hypothetical protein
MLSETRDVVQHIRQLNCLGLSARSGLIDARIVSWGCLGNTVARFFLLPNIPSLMFC